MAEVLTAEALEDVVVFRVMVIFTLDVNVT